MDYSLCIYVFKKKIIAIIKKIYNQDYVYNTLNDILEQARHLSVSKCMLDKFNIFGRDFVL